jgi:3D (Asp-Asp-Asp) domain-containing protein
MADEVISLTTRTKGVGEILREAGIDFTEEYDVYPAIDESLTQRRTIEVIPPSPVTVAFDGQEKRLWTKGASVADLLTSAGVELGPHDGVEPGLETFIVSPSLIKVTRINYVDEVVEEPIPYAVRRREDPSLEKGTEKIVQRGRDGIKEKVVRITYADGQPQSQQIIATSIKEPPQEEIIAIGTKIVIRTMATPGGPIRYREVLDMVATAYYPGPESTGPWADGYTVTGDPAGYGVVAVDPGLIPLGTTLYIPGYGTARACDIGGAIKGNIIDLCFDTYREAIHFGRRPVKVYILE